MKKNIIISIFIMIIIMLGLYLIKNKVNAETFNVNDNVNLGEYNIYYRNGASFIRYQGIGQVNYMYFYRDYNGVEHKAFCLNLGIPGAEDGDYVVDANQIIQDPKVACILLSGSPYKTLQELGLSNEEEATFATQFAVWAYLKPLDLNQITPYTAGNQEHINVVNAIKKIYADGISLSNNYSTQAIININKDGDTNIDNIDRKFYSQKYKISHNSNIKNISVSTLGINNIKIVDMSNVEINDLNNVNEFKVLIPRESITEDKELLLNFRVETKQTSVMFGVTKVDGRQNMALTLDPVNLKSVQDRFTVKYRTTKIKLKKIDNYTKAPISNVKFRFETLDGKNLGDFTTNDKGIIELDVQKDLNIFQEQKIKVTEIETPNNYVLDKENNSKLIDITWEKDISLQFENEHKKGSLKVVKVDKDNNNITLGNVEFDLFSKEFNEVVGTYKTDVNGEIFIENLRTGEYSLIETKTNKWYNLTSDTEIEVEWNLTKEIQIENELKKGSIKVIKVDKDNNEVRLANVQFNVLDKDGNILEQIITDKNGEAKTSKYPIRDFEQLTIRESKTLENYVLTEEQQTVELKQDEITNLTFQNEKKKGQIRIIKVDKDNNEVRLAGVEFNVYDEQDNLVDTLITDENGEAVSKRLSIDKKYRIQESKTLENYVLTEEMQTVELKQDEITSLTFQNERIKGNIKIIKYSEKSNEYSKLEKGARLENAVFEIYDEQDNLVDILITDENGEAVSKELYKGKYTIREVIAPTYYVINKNTFELEITNHQEVVELNVTDDNVDIDVEIEKNGFIETQNKDTIFYDFKNIHNKSNVPLSHFVWNDTLPTDAVRLDKIYTGIWNEKLEYEVWYKTNKEDFKLFRDKLDTETVYELDFNNLELQKDEYITEFEFRFGTVKIDFHEIESPIVYVNILDGLKNGYIFTNNTKVSGDYLGKTIEDKDKWNTVIYNKTLSKCKILPKTRYLVE